MIAWVCCGLSLGLAIFLFCVLVSQIGGKIPKNLCFLAVVYYAMRIHEWLWPSSVDWREGKTTTQLKESLGKLPSHVEEIWLPLQLSDSEYLELLEVASALPKDVNFVTRVSFIPNTRGYSICGGKWVTFSARTEHHKRSSNRQ